MKARTKLLLGVGIAALALVVPSSAMAAGHTATSTVAGLAASELGVVAPTPPSVLNLKHSEAATTALPSTVGVVSTLPSWSLQISDASGSGEPGHMYAYNLGELACLADVGGTVNTDKFLANALHWQRVGGNPFAPLSDDPAEVGSGGLPGGTFDVHFQQTLHETDEVAVGDCYKVTVTYTLAAT